MTHAASAEAGSGRGSEGAYGKEMFSAADFEALRALLEGLQGKFLLSINDTPEIRKIFSGFALEEVTVHYSTGINKGQRPRFGELIISGPKR